MHQLFRLGSIYLQGILTILRDRTTTRGDFIFFVDRLSTFLMEKATEFLPYRAKSVDTPVGVSHTGKEIAAEVRLSVFNALFALTHLLL